MIAKIAAGGIATSTCEFDVNGDGNRVFTLDAIAPNTGDSLSSLYEAPFRFTGKILNVTIELKPQAPISEETAKKTEERAHAVSKIDQINAGRSQLPSGRNHWCPS